MTQSLIVDPSKVRAPGRVEFPEVPINQYSFDLDAEIGRHGEDGLVNMLHDMIVVRTFESMLDSIKKTGEWQGVAYNHKGPAHLGIGQESAYVGQAAVLTPDDQVFGSHRSHGEILAKCYSAMRQLPADQLEQIMTTFLDGETLSFAEKIDYSDTLDLTENFILFGALAEIFARKSGFNRGLGGSMHTFFLPFGSYPNNAIVGGSAPVANGAALFKRITRKPGIVVSNVGDAALACGPVWEAMNFAAMDQFRTLWREEDGGNPPILFNFFNNFYGMGGQTYGETMGYDVLARVGAALNPEAMHAERVDGINPLAVADAVSRKKKILEEGRGPVLMDTITYRFSGHSPSDASSYRTKDEVSLWEEVDCIATYSDLLISNGLTSRSDIDDYTAGLTEKLVKVLQLAIDEENCPRVADGYIDTVMFSNTPVDAMEEGEAEIDLTDNPRVKALEKKIRTAVDENGKPVSKMRMYQFRDGLFEAMLHRFTEDPTMAAWGEENRDWGGAFAVYRGLTEALPYRRLFNSPIAEASIVGAGVGYAMAGGRAVVELMYCDFLGRAGDEVFNQMAKWQSMSAGLLKMPLVLRVSVGNKYGAQHSQDWSALTAHIPGLKVYFPTTPTDAKGMLNLALRGTDPVVFFESQLLYDKGEEFEPGGVPEGYYETPEGEPAIRREGTDITIAGYGATMYRAMEAAQVLEDEYGMSAEVIDLRFVAPLNYDTLIESVKKTGRLLLTSDAVERGSFLNTVAANVQTLAFDALDAPIAIVGSRNGITPGPELESYFFPQVDWIIDAIHERIVPLPGRVPSTAHQTEGEIARLNRLGL
ncbi:thiamine pyrophosphate-dependent enzyme [Actinomyces sp. B33]|uniref:alpha-ketoacid dehydrogenase subunit alpha/beta n=1 Tax=Actinomyces sp. B33 TaxID=2942131 RepID=UPI00233F830B|nr:alpha-ketoacid dehydrogenase subunit alpha/beta [Actinomyces sp. B33]MDC4232109.1 thiamine pyrophosphate-dependent enzyme [Actinomyces sp. B33]